MSNHITDLGEYRTHIITKICTDVHNYFLQTGDPTPNHFITQRYSRDIRRFLKNKTVCSFIEELCPLGLLLTFTTLKGHRLYYPHYLRPFFADFKTDEFHPNTPEYLLCRSWDYVHKMELAGGLSGFSPIMQGRCSEQDKVYKLLRAQLLKFYRDTVRHSPMEALPDYDIPTIKEE
jgi:hypothetical protein